MIRRDAAPAPVGDALRFVVFWRQADWGFYYRRNEAFARALAAHPEVGAVVHLETVSLKGVAATLLRALTATEPGLRAAYRLQLRKALSRRPVPLSDRLAVQSILIPAFSARPLLTRVNRWLFRRQAARLRARVPTVLLAYPPAGHLEDLLAVLRPDLLMADLVDDVPAQEPNPRRRAEKERAFVRHLPRCAAVFATSDRIAVRYGRHASGGIEFLPNGVRVDNPRRGTDEPPGERHLRRCRVCYAGMLNGTLDTDLVEHLLVRNPDLEFVLIGPAEGPVVPFLKRITGAYPHCRHLGRMQHDDMRRRLAGCDVLVNLKRADRSTRGNDAIKIYEYLATGKPVVSTPMAPADRMRELIYVAEDRHAFQRLLTLALVEDDPELRAARRRTAAGNAWEKRVERIVARSRSLMGRQPSPSPASEARDA